MEGVNETEANNTTVTVIPISPRMRSLFDINYNLGVIYVLIITLLSIAGIAGNSAILYVMKKEPQVKGHARLLMSNMALADLCVTGIANPMCIIGAFTGMHIMQWGSWLCISVASLCLTACICVFLNIVNITVNRWIFICFANAYDKIYNKTSVIVLCVACWMIGFGVELPNFIGWGDHTFDEKTHLCTWDRHADRSYTVLVSAGFIIVPLVLILYCNMSMIKRIWDVKRNIHGYKASYSKSVIATVSQVKILMTIMIITLICWLPYVTLLLKDHGNEASMETNLFITLLAHSHSTWTPVIYLCYQTKFRDHIHRLVCPVKVIVPFGRADAGSTRTVDANSATASQKKTLHRVQPCSPNENSKCNTPLSANTVFSPHISTPLAIKSCVLQPREVFVFSSSTSDVAKQSILANTGLGNSHASSLMHLKSTTMFACDRPKSLSDQLLPPVEHHDPTESVFGSTTATGTSYCRKAHNYSIA